MLNYLIDPEAVMEMLSPIPLFSRLLSRCACGPPPPILAAIGVSHVPASPHSWQRLHTPPSPIRAFA